MLIKMNTAPKAILLCGKIGSGKSTYAEKLRKQCHAVVLSCDEITLALFGNDVGEKHDDFVERTQNYLFEKSLAILEIGVSVILEWGFWLKEERDAARAFYESRGIAYEFHYVAVSEQQWKRNLAGRNQAVVEGKTSAYFVDEGLAEKMSAMFEVPEREAMDVWYVNERDIT